MITAAPPFVRLFTLVPSLTGAENLVISRADAPGIIDWRKEKRALDAFIERMPFRVPLDTQVSGLSAVSYRAVGREEESTQLQAWPAPLALGQPLPTLPLWLTDTLYVPLDLERSYEQACEDLSIP